jgi:hypothetical protein
VFREYLPAPRVDLDLAGDGHARTLQAEVELKGRRFRRTGSGRSATLGITSRVARCGAGVFVCVAAVFGAGLRLLAGLEDADAKVEVHVAHDGRCLVEADAGAGGCGCPDDFGGARPARRTAAHSSSQ